MPEQRKPPEPQDDDLQLEEHVLEDLEVAPEEAEKVQGGNRPVASSINIGC
jgi:hypothetical protein